MFEIVNGEIKCSEEVLAVFEEAKRADLEQKRIKIQLDMFKDELKKVMRESGIKKVSTDFLTATYVAPMTKRVVDTNSLKEQGLYESFTKISEVGDSVKVSFKHDI